MVSCKLTHASDSPLANFSPFPESSRLVCGQACLVTRLSAILGETHKPKAKAFFCDLRREHTTISELRKQNKQDERSSQSFPPRRSFWNLCWEPGSSGLDQPCLSEQLAVSSGCWLETAPAFSKVALHCLDMASLPGLALGLVRLLQHP